VLEQLSAVMDGAQGAWQSPQPSGLQPPPGFQQQQQVVLQPAVPQRSQMRGALAVISTKVLSSLLIACGASMIIIQIACTAIAAESWYHGGYHILGAGIWCGVIVTISGIIGLCAASWKSNGLVITFLVFNVLCTAFFSLLMISFTGIDLSFRYHTLRGPYYSALVGMTSFLLLDAVVVFGISIWGIASNSCAIQKAKACMCCCVESPPQTRPVVVYLPANQASQINATAGQVVHGGVAPMPQTFYAHGQNAFAGAAQASQINATAVQVVPGGVAPVPQTFYAHGQSAFAGAAQETGAPIDPPPYKSLEES